VPTYDYRCEKGHRYERREPFGSPSEHACEKCGTVAKRQLNAPALAFKGGGFYVTDSRNKGKGGSSSNGSGSSNGSSGSSSSSPSSSSSSSSD
jgi:putative FmdB family regulatory protein